LRAFRQGLSESGHVEERNVAIEYRWAESRYDRLPDLAGDLVGRGVNVIVANGPAIARPLRLDVFHASAPSATSIRCLQRSPNGASAAS
jgi:hypothetical protein